ncbi:MAG: globin [Aquabacterium sp.]|nr:MAG: globin [Aquabacterium sp.]
MSTSTPYDLIGGEAGVRRLVQRFYALMDELPEAAAVRAVHPPSLAGSEQKLFEYFSGWLGGPPLFEAKYGHPRLRARHLPFSIGTRERDEWLLCMRRALDETVEHEQLRELLFEKMAGLADHMRNREDE